MKSLELVVSYLEKIKDVSGRLDKMDLLKKLVKEDHEDVFRTMLEYTYNPYWNYWMTWDPDQYENHKRNLPLREANWRSFVKILDELKERKVTGDKARNKVLEFFKHSCNTRERYWFAQVLNRKLEIGLLMRSFSKVFPDLLPTISFMLAGTWDKKSNLRGDWICEPKIDGERAAVIFDKKGIATVVSRNGHPKTNCEHIVDSLRPAAEEVGFAVVFDGELAGKSWGDVGASRGKKKSKKKLHYNVFDLIPLICWEKKKFIKVPGSSETAYYAYRRNYLRELVEDLCDNTYVHLLEGVTLHNPTVEMLLKLRDRFIKAGHEGWIVKRALSFYLFDRDEIWLKCKFRESVDLKIVDAKPGGKRLKGWGIGALVCEGWVGKGKNRVKVKTEVGQGFSDKFRKKFHDLWQQNKLKGLVIEVDHYGLTSALRAKGSTRKESALRNAIFKRIRKRQDREVMSGNNV